ncbi:MAG: ATP-binding protein, partial [Spirochaetaceae bacterium]|nr:ATP-binding protein [Spirochaetaceae bacterium]
VEIHAEVSDSSVLVVIEDTGPGIKEDELEKIFERFYRTDNSRNRVSGGSGLGLAISREIIKLHGGNIYAQSKQDRGASIFISIPF